MPLNGIEGIFFVSMTCGVNGIEEIGPLGLGSNFCQNERENFEKENN